MRRSVQPSALGLFILVATVSAAVRVGLAYTSMTEFAQLTQADAIGIGLVLTLPAGLEFTVLHALQRTGRI